MKVCPVCNETFADELKFCDLDGTRLKREVGSETPEKQNKAWSLIGVGLLVGALVLSALSIIFLPKARIAPTVANSESGAATTSARPESAQTEIAQGTSPDSASPEIVVEELPPVELKKKDSALQNINGNANAAAPNPKAAAKAASEEENPAPADPTAVAPPPPREPEPAPAVVKPTADARDAGSAPASAEMKRDPKRDSSRANDEDKKADTKKTDDKKKKKGGGIFGAFKKIFGKD
jgi:hypothetical protein